VRREDEIVFGGGVNASSATDDLDLVLVLHS
jgi:hypothetical protein